MQFCRSMAPERLRRAYGLPSCCLRAEHDGDHADAVGSRWTSNESTSRAPEPVPVGGWPPSYVDEDGIAHGWDDPVESDDEAGEPYTYRELIYDLADARGCRVEDILGWMRLRVDGAEDMSPEWIDDSC